MPTLLKSLLGSAVHHSGALRLVQKLNEGSVRILMYHRFPERYAENFERQCQFLATEYKVVPLTEAVERLAGGESVRDLVVLTIDDGHADMHDVAFPVLQKHGLPATLFVTTGFVDRACWMPGDVVRAFFDQGIAGRGVEVQDETGKTQTFQTGEAGAADRLRELLKRIPNTRRREALATLSAALPAPESAAMPKAYTACNWGQLRTMAKRGIAMGAHTVTHPILSRVETLAEKERELLASKARLEFQLDRAVDSFAYPNGGTQDYDGDSLQVVRRSFRNAVTAVYGMNVQGADPHQLLRLPCDPDLPVPSLARMLAGPIRGRVQPVELVKAAS